MTDPNNDPDFDPRPDDNGDQPPRKDSKGRPIGPHGCSGNSRNDQEPCKGWAITGTTKCYHHTNPHNKRKLKEGVRGRELDIIVGTSIFNDTTDKLSPLEALFAELARTQTIVTWLGNLLDEMAKSDPELLITMATKELEEGTRPMTLRGHTGMLNVIRRQLVRTESGLAPFVLWFLRERDHLVRVSQLLVALGVKLDEIDLSRKQGDQIIQAMRNFALALGQRADDPEIMSLIAESLDSVVMGG